MDTSCRARAYGGVSVFLLPCAFKKAMAMNTACRVFLHHHPLLVTRLVREFVRLDPRRRGIHDIPRERCSVPPSNRIAKRLRPRIPRPERQSVDLELGSILDSRAPFEVDAALRLESGDDVGDSSNIYAITDPATKS